MSQTNTFIDKKTAEIKEQLDSWGYVWSEDAANLIKQALLEQCEAFEQMIVNEPEVSGCNCDQCRKRDNADVYVRNSLRTQLREKLSKYKGVSSGY